MSRPVKAYVTKYALTVGIFSVEGQANEDGKFLSFRRTASQYTEHAHANEWFEDEALAKKNAERRRLKKIASLQKQIAKLEQLRF